MIRTIKYSLIIVIQLLVIPIIASSSDSLVTIANNAYNNGLYDSALTTYNRIIDNNIESGELYYNMGNAYFKTDDIASSILYYEKAKKLLPNDENIKYNLSIVNSMIVDKIDKVPELFYERWWNFFYNMLNTDSWAIFSLISFSLFVITIGLFILSRKRSSRKLSFFIGMFFLFTTTTSTILAYQKYYLSIDHNEGIVFTSSITIKSSPTQNAVDLFVIHEGTKVKIVDRIDNWVEIKIKNGSIGWLPEKSIKEI